MNYKKLLEELLKMDAATLELPALFAFAEKNRDVFYPITYVKNSPTGYPVLRGLEKEAE